METPCAHFSPALPCSSSRRLVLRHSPTTVGALHPHRTKSSIGHRRPSVFDHHSPISMTTGRRLITGDRPRRMMTTTTMMGRLHRLGRAPTRGLEQAHHQVSLFAFCAGCGAGVAASAEPFSYRPASLRCPSMLSLTSILTRSVLVVATVGGLAVLADGAVRSELERAVRGDLSIVGRAPVQVARADERYVAKGLDRSRFGATMRMVGADDTP